MIYNIAIFLTLIFLADEYITIMDKLKPRIREVIASLEIEGFAIDDSDVIALQQLDNGEATVDELIEIIIRHYKAGEF